MNRCRGASLLAVLALLLGTACSVPSEPSPADWRAAAIQALEDVAGQLGTVELVLAQEQDDKLLGRYAVVVASEAEEAAGTSAESLTSQQPPAGTRQRFGTVSGALDEATSLLTEARVALVDDDRAKYSSLRRRITRLQQRLDEIRGRLR